MGIATIEQLRQKTSKLDINKVPYNNQNHPRGDYFFFLNNTKMKIPEGIMPGNQN